MQNLRFLRVISTTPHATANTHKTVAHGLVGPNGNKLIPNHLQISVRGAAVSTTAETASTTQNTVTVLVPIAAHIVSVDNTNVVFKCNSNAAGNVIDIAVGYVAEMATA